MSTLEDYRGREHWNFSALNQFLNICSLQYAFDRVYKLPKEFMPVSLSFGSAFHRTLEGLHLMLKDGGCPQEQDARDLFRDLWSRQEDIDAFLRLRATAGGNREAVV